MSEIGIRLIPCIAKLDSAQQAGLKITANMYTYIASATGLTARLPTWVQEGGAAAMRKRLRTPSIRKKVLDEMRLGIPTKNSDPKDVMMLGFRLDSLNKLYLGKRLDEVARIHGKDADETAIDLIVKDRSTIAAIYLPYFRGQCKADAQTSLCEFWFRCCFHVGSRNF